MAQGILPRVYQDKELGYSFFNDFFIDIQQQKYIFSFHYLLQALCLNVS